MSALGQKQTFAMQNVMFALQAFPIAWAHCGNPMPNREGNAITTPVASS
jgi:hypothetical protein